VQYFAYGKAVLAHPCASLHNAILGQTATTQHGNPMEGGAKLAASCYRSLPASMQATPPQAK